MGRKEHQKCLRVKHCALLMMNSQHLRYEALLCHQRPSHSRHRREDDCDDIKACYMQWQKVPQKLMDQFYPRRGCAGKNVMVCKDCSASNMTLIHLHAWRENFEVPSPPKQKFSRSPAWNSRGAFCMCRRSRTSAS